MTVKSNADHSDIVFNGVDAQASTVERSVFDGCSFVDCNFSRVRLAECRFRDCEFRNSNFSSVAWDDSRVLGISFLDCKVAGVNWTTLDWSALRLGFPISFASCDISFSVFNSLALKGLTLRDCKAHDVDFSDCDLEGAELCRTDFKGARFSACRLNSCDFRGATDYFIDPLESSINNARFSTPEVLGLLRSFNIEIE